MSALEPSGPLVYVSCFLLCCLDCSLQPCATCWERADLLALFPIENITGIIEDISGLPLEIICII